jgi:hypothetical protein
MKKIVLLIFVLAAAGRSFAQLAANDSSKKVFVLSLGVHQSFMNNPAFNAWTLSNYNKKINSTINGEGDLTFFMKKYDAGLHYSSANSFDFTALYFGLRLTSVQSKVSSWLNFDFGGLNIDRSDLAPVDYTLTPDQQGKKLKLEYSMYYIGLTSKNYLNNLHFHFGKHKKTSFNTGFYLSAGYDPFNDRAWSYGYDDNANATIDSDGNTTVPFKSVKVNSVPLLNRFFMEAGIFVGIGN